MNSLLRHIALCGLVIAVAGCSTVKEASDTVGGWFGGSSGELSAPTEKKGIGSGPTMKYAATLRIGKLIDQRKVSDPRYLGVNTSRIDGYTGRELIMDQDIATMATTALKRRFDGEGFDVLEGTSSENALFEVTGFIKELRLDVKERDYIAITIEASLKEVANGNVIWSGVVTEKNDRFAGVGGNKKQDVVYYLNTGLKTVNGKFVEAMTAALQATRPELFNLTPGSKPIPGVTVLVAPKSAAVAPAAAPTHTPYGAQGYGVSADAPVPPSTYKPHASDTAGLLLVNTNPQRARVYLDEVYYGLSPLRLEIEPGVHSISVKLPGYKMVTEKVSVRRGDNTEMELTLEQ